MYHCGIYSTASQESSWLWAASPVSLEASVEPGSFGSSLTQRDSPPLGRRKQNRLLTMTLQFEWLQGAMMLWAAGGIYLILSRPLLTPLDSQSSTAQGSYTSLSSSSSHLHKQKKRVMHEHSRQSPLSAIIVFLFCFLLSLFLSEMAASRHFR